MLNKIDKITLKNVSFIKATQRLLSYSIFKDSNGIAISLCFEIPENKDVEYEVEGEFFFSSEDGGDKVQIQDGKVFYEIYLTKDNEKSFFDFLEEEGIDVLEIKERFLDRDFSFCLKEIKSILEDIKQYHQGLQWGNCRLLLLKGDLFFDVKEVEKGKNKRFENDSLASEGTIIFANLDIDIIKKIEEAIKTQEKQETEEKLDKVFIERTSKYNIYESNENSNIKQEKEEEELFVQFMDIEEELEHYKHFFKGKTVYCNYDNPKVSNFCKYFLTNFKTLGLKRLICTCLSPELNIKGYVLDTNLSKTKIYELNGTGDFRTPECVDYLQEADIVVTNPPFSLIRDFIDLMIKYNKYFLIVGTQMCLCYKNVFPYVKEGFIKTGYNNVNYFITPDGSLSDRFGNVLWITNLPIKKEIEPFVLSKTYNPIDYPKYENHEAIEVSKIKDIPYDFPGVMGVPITFVLKYDPNQFEVLGMDSDNVIKQPDGTLKKVFKRVFIRNKHPILKKERRIY